MPGSYIVAGARTPIGKMSGALASLSAADLGGAAIAAALERAGVAPDEVDHVLMGQVLMAGQGQVPSRQAAVKAGIPMSTPSVNVNKVCLSGLNTIYLADQMIAAGEADIVVAGGMESMTNAPYLADGARGGFRYGNTELRDAIIADGLWCAFDACLMGLGTERYAAGTISREAQDELAATSHERAANAIKDGRFADEIVAGVDPAAQGRPDRRRARRGRPARHDGRQPRRPAPGVRQGRHGHRRQRQPAQRRRQRRRADVEARRPRRAASQPLGEFVVLRHGRRARLGVAAAAAEQRHPQGARPRPGWSSATSTCSRSTRRSPPSGWPRWPTSASPPTSSTSTAAPSPSATRSA